MTATLESVTIKRQILKEEEQHVLKCSECGVQFPENQRLAAERHLAEHVPLVYENPTGYGGVYVVFDAIRNGRVAHKVHGQCSIRWKGVGWYVHVEEEEYCGGGDYQPTDVLVHVDAAHRDLREKIRELGEDYRRYTNLKKKPAP